MRLLITAGPTREPLDAVRFLSNRSSGKVGLALAAAGQAAGHEVTLLLGPGPETSDVQRQLAADAPAPAANQKSEIRNQKSASTVSSPPRN
jgi:phosphopantothenoylcysteine synthetase/decarboxylase